MQFFLSFALLTLLPTVTFSLPIQDESETLFSQQRQILIGYRYVHEKVAEKYNKAGTLTNELANGVQLGEGAYSVAAPGEWPGGKWLCVLLAHEEEVARVRKLWIPENFHPPAAGGVPHGRSALGSKD
ncbi:hypothetical protein BKA70DRAFT_1480518 [Coprinopsis sp. MPI-PUGE-AT-0042]|nr:hypothetical protein BKA70DRAFT_1480518 [Coprinopsis sp. MPI-PUGE-AT-0042]